MFFQTRLVRSQTSLNALGKSGSGLNQSVDAPDSPEVAPNPNTSVADPVSTSPLDLKAEKSEEEDGGKAKKKLRFTRENGGVFDVKRCFERWKSWLKRKARKHRVSWYLPSIHQKSWAPRPHHVSFSGTLWVDLTMVGVLYRLDESFLTGGFHTSDGFWVPFFLLLALYDAWEVRPWWQAEFRVKGISFVHAILSLASWLIIALLGASIPFEAYSARSNHQSGMNSTSTTLSNYGNFTDQGIFEWSSYDQSVFAYLKLAHGILRVVSYLEVWKFSPSKRARIAALPRLVTYLCGTLVLIIPPILISRDIPIKYVSICYLGSYVVQKVVWNCIFFFDIKKMKSKSRDKDTLVRVNMPFIIARLRDWNQLQLGACILGLITSVDLTQGGQTTGANLYMVLVFSFLFIAFLDMLTYASEPTVYTDHALIVGGVSSIVWFDAFILLTLSFLGIAVGLRYVLQYPVREEDQKPQLILLLAICSTTSILFITLQETQHMSRQVIDTRRRVWLVNMLLAFTCLISPLLILTTDLPDENLGFITVNLAMSTLLVLIIHAINGGFRREVAKKTQIRLRGHLLAVVIARKWLLLYRQRKEERRIDLESGRIAPQYSSIVLRTGVAEENPHDITVVEEEALVDGDDLESQFSPDQSQRRLRRHRRHSGLYVDDEEDDDEDDDEQQQGSGNAKGASSMPTVPETDSTPAKGEDSSRGLQGTMKQSPKDLDNQPTGSKRKQSSLGSGRMRGDYSEHVGEAPGSARSSINDVDSSTAEQDDDLEEGEGIRVAAGLRLPDNNNSNEGAPEPKLIFSSERARAFNPRKERDRPKVLTSFMSERNRTIRIEDHRQSGDGGPALRARFLSERTRTIGEDKPTTDHGSNLEFDSLTFKPITASERNRFFSPNASRRSYGGSLNTSRRSRTSLLDVNGSKRSRSSLGDLGDSRRSRMMSIMRDVNSSVRRRVFGKSDSEDGNVTGDKPIAIRVLKKVLNDHFYERPHLLVEQDVFAEYTLSWSDLFLDIIYIGVVYRLGDYLLKGLDLLPKADKGKVVKVVPATVFLFACLFLAVFNLWWSKLQFSSKCGVTDVFHKFLDITQGLLVVLCALNITSPQALSQPESTTPMVISALLAGFHVSLLFLWVEVLFSKPKHVPTRACAMRNLRRSFLSLFALFLAMLTSGLNGPLVLISAFWALSWLAPFVERLVTLRMVKQDERAAFLLRYVLHRLGDGNMILLGEGVFQIIRSVSRAYQGNVFVVFTLCFLNMSAVRVALFEMDCFDEHAKKHVVLRSRLGHLAVMFIRSIASPAVICIGVALKVIVSRADDGARLTSGPNGSSDTCGEHVQVYQILCAGNIISLTSFLAIYHIHRTFFFGGQFRWKHFLFGILLALSFLIFPWIPCIGLAGMTGATLVIWCIAIAFHALTDDLFSYSDSVLVDSHAPRLDGGAGLQPKPMSKEEMTESFMQQKAKEDVINESRHLFRSLKSKGGNHASAQYIFRSSRNLLSDLRHRASSVSSITKAFLEGVSPSPAQIRATFGSRRKYSIPPLNLDKYATSTSSPPSTNIPQTFTSESPVASMAAQNQSETIDSPFVAVGLHLEGSPRIRHKSASPLEPIVDGKDSETPFLDEEDEHVAPNTSVEEVPKSAEVIANEDHQQSVAKNCEEEVQKAKPPSVVAMI